MFPELEYHPYRYDKQLISPDLNAARRYIIVNSEIPLLGWLKPGEKHGHEMMNFFIKNSLSKYAQFSNDPNISVLSNLSPYIHFGQISAQRVAQEVSSQSASKGINDEAFLDQLIVRRELSDNHCNYCNDYDSFEGVPQWAHQTLNEHRDDQREYMLYDGRI